MVEIKRDNYDFEVGDELSDVRLIVEDRVLHVHKAILENLKNEVKLPGKKYDDIIEMLKMIYPNFLKEFDENKLESLLELSEEYDMRKIKHTIEKHLLKKLSEMWSRKKSAQRLYGREINEKLEYLMQLISISSIFELRRLKQECVVYVASTFDKQLIECNEHFSNLNESIRLELLSKKVDLLEEKLKCKEQKLKTMEDEILKQKFEIQRLNFLIDSK